MEELLTELVGAVLQLLVALLLAGLAYGGHRAVAAIRKRSGESFRSWVGLGRPTASWASRVGLVVGLTAFSVGMIAVEYGLGLHRELTELMGTVPVATLAGIEPAVAALGAGVAYAFLRTAGSEELLFRGVLYRRLIGWMGYRAANVVQATLFAVLHNGLIGLVASDASLLLHADVFLRIWIPSWVVGWFMVRRDGGSILMPWVCHGIANLLTFLVFFVTG